MSKWQFTKGLHETGDGVYAYLQPDGSWGWSNAGLIESQGETLLVDTLMGVDITRDMLEEMRRKVPQSAKIDRLVNTHANADHFLGNELVAGAEIIAGKKAAEDIAATNMARLERIFAKEETDLGEAGEFLYETMGQYFDVSGVTLTPPNRTFEGELDLMVGEKLVKLIDLGPAHTKSDTIVYVPGDRTIFTGDLLFNEGTPVMWAGPVQNWIDACDYMLNLDVDVIVPGHGPIADKASVRSQKVYFEFVRDEARKRYDAGMGWEEAARDMVLGEYAKWLDAERIVGNVFTLYREFGETFPAGYELHVYGAMSRWRDMVRDAHSNHDHRNCNHA
ncbi:MULTISPECIES: MBL fold metallo-hydrolase [unclassified Sphingomonas]|uniref:MBL fold metallo-hydrolase n=1 Tax=unclassified Sphingomonas TaxID=196159 RepID=UPI0006F2B713|nr:MULTISPECIES: MBL fold metallo-hydrolase [unclassified Sphingomonas]KQX18807.1 MBL fold metallo-hydrolase [Sphingomonas sp. Root1294]KQY72372.1 MBL fold metallo-hydrolase [Sphingomonas sp. Root50]KRB95487.1 MBL fold metallo-hydrolase [Sphingomonas sp. Root720]